MYSIGNVSHLLIAFSYLSYLLDLNQCITALVVFAEQLLGTCCRTMQSNTIRLQCISLMAAKCISWQFITRNGIVQRVDSVRGRQQSAKAVRLGLERKSCSNLWVTRESPRTGALQY